MPTDKKYEESMLLSLLAQDSEYAFQLIFDRYRNNIYKVAMLYVKSPVVAEEIVQDVFLKLWFQRHHLQQLKSLESWLFIVARNLTINSFKKIVHEWKAREKWVEGYNAADYGPDLPVISKEFQSFIHQAINNLSTQQQQVFRMAREQGLSYEEIGIKLSISPLTVKTHMQRALQSIRVFLQTKGISIVLLMVLFPH